eukprot:2311482-Rhodomonas_salina.2
MDITSPRQLHPDRQRGDRDRDSDSDSDSDIDIDRDRDTRSTHSSASVWDIAQRTRRRVAEHTGALVKDTSDSA